MISVTNTEVESCHRYYESNKCFYKTLFGKEITILMLSAGYILLMDGLRQQGEVKDNVNKLLNGD